MVQRLRFIARGKLSVYIWVPMIFIIHIFWWKLMRLWLQSRDRSILKWPWRWGRWPASRGPGFPRLLLKPLLLVPESQYWSASQEQDIVYKNLLYTSWNGTLHFLHYRQQGSQSQDFILGP